MRGCAAVLGSPYGEKVGMPWYAAGIGGTVVLMLIWVITRMPGNPITGRGGGVNEMAMAVEALQGAFIGLSIAIIALETRTKSVKTAGT